MLQTTLKIAPVDNVGGSSEEVEGLDAKLGRPEDSPTKCGEGSGPRVNSFTRGRGQALASSSPAIMGGGGFGGGGGGVGYGGSGGSGMWGRGWVHLWSGQPAAGPATYVAAGGSKMHS